MDCTSDDVNSALADGANSARADEIATTSLILTADPAFEQMAMDELHAVAPEAFVQAKLEPGVLLVGLDDAFTKLAETWRTSPPIFVRHICPAHVTAQLEVSSSLLEEITMLFLSELSAYVDERAPFSVQTRVLPSIGFKPFDINNMLSNLVQEISGAVLNVREPEQVISVVIAGAAEQNHQTEASDDGRQVNIYLGLSAVALNLSSWAGGMHRFARDPQQISRSEFKLLEALDHFRIELQPRGVALDLGAAPGGWTRILRLYEQYVTAVDPADLDPALATDPRVRHKRMTAQRYLQEGPDMFDLIVNDMRMDARDSARMLGSFAPYLHAHGMAILTMKLPERGRWNVVRHGLEILEGAYSVAGARQLFHNRSEITVVLRPK